MTVRWETVLADIADREADARAGTHPPPAVGRSIRRRRATRVAALAGAVGSVLGVAGWEALQPPPPAVPEAEAMSLSAPVALDIVNDRSLSAFGAPPACGSIAPTVRTNFAGIRITPTLDEDITNDPGAGQNGGTLAQRVTAEDPAALGTPVEAVMGVIYAKGGVVVGYSTASADPVFGRLGVNVLFPSVAAVAASPSCLGTSVDLTHGLPTGDYQAFPVVRIHASPQVAAWRALLERDSTLHPGRPLDLALAPGTPACQSMVDAVMGGKAANLPPECTGAARTDVTGMTGMTGMTGTSVSVRYPLDYYKTDLDLVLVGNPVTFSVRQPLDSHQTATPGTADGTPWPADPRCGALYTDKPTTDATPVYVSVAGVPDGGLAAGALVSLEVGVRTSRAPASVAFDGPLDVWTTAPWGYSRTVRQIVGHGLVTFTEFDGVQLSTVEPSALVTGTLMSFDRCTGVVPAPTTRTAVTGMVVLSDATGTAEVRTVDVR